MSEASADSIVAMVQRLMKTKFICAVARDLELTRKQGVVDMIHFTNSFKSTFKFASGLASSAA